MPSSIPANSFKLNQACEVTIPTPPPNRAARRMATYNWLTTVPTGLVVSSSYIYSPALCWGR